MRKKLSFMLILTLMITALTPMGAMAADTETATAYSNTKKLAAEKAELLTKTHGTTSLQYALIDGSDIVVSGQSGIDRLADGTAPTAESMYAIGSTGKMFATAAVMKLIDEGKVNLDSPVTMYIPEFKMKDERYKQITVRMLLNHSSGLEGSTLGNSFLFDDTDTYYHDTLLTKLAEQSLKADPGAYSVYCNDGFTLVEILVERVSGTDFTSYIHQNFTETLGMNHTKSMQDKVSADEFAGVYYATYGGQLPVESVNAIGTGGIYSTAEDLVRFAQIFTGQVSGILSEQSVTAMEQKEYKRGFWPADADNSYGFGLGWDSVDMFPFSEYDIQALTKGGDVLFSHSSLVVLPDHNMAAAVVSSGGSSMTDQLLANEILIAALQEKGIIKELKPAKSFGVPVKADMPQDMMKVEGFYGASTMLYQATISEEGELSISYPMIEEYPPSTYTYTADGSFVNADGSDKITFVTEENGRTYIWNQTYISLPDLGQTVISQYSAEKLNDNEISEDTAAVWEKRNGKRYYPLDEKYTSQIYLLGLPATELVLLDETPGYLVSYKITSENSAAGDLYIPLSGGRDMSEFSFFMQNGLEYLKAAGSLYVHEDAVKPLYAGRKSTATIQADGYARWFSVPEALAGKTMTVKLPANGSFAVYDAMEMNVNYSIVSGDNKVELPAGGVIVFAGDAGAKFGITVK